MVQVSREAALFYKNEMELSEGECLKVFVQYGGLEAGGYALGVAKDIPGEEDLKQVIEGITFFSCEDDNWFTSKLQMDFDDSASDIKLTLIS